MEFELPLRADPLLRARDPAPEDPARRDVRGAHARQPRTHRPCPENGSLGTAQVSDTVQLDFIFCTFDADTRAAFQVWMQEQARGDRRLRARPQRRARQPRPVRRGHGAARRHPQPQEGAVTSLVSNTGVVFEALTERGGQLRSLIENSNRVFAGDGVEGQRAQGGVHRAADVRARVRPHAAAAGRVRRGHRPADHAAAARRARAEPDTSGPRCAVARPGGTVP